MLSKLFRRTKASPRRVAIRPSGTVVLAGRGDTILEQALAERARRGVTLFLGARAERDLYGLAEIEAIRREWPEPFDVVPVLSEESEASSWSGRRGLVTGHLDAVLGDALSFHDAYLCGPPPMIDAAIPILVAGGIPESRIHFDKFLDRSHLAEDGARRAG